MRRIALASTTLLALCTGAPAADQVKLGNLTQLSGPISPAGTETKRGIDLALEELGNKLGGLPVKYTVVDDKTNPAEAVQGASKLIDSAVTEVGGKIENKDAVRAALRKANFQSVRGSFKFNNNHFPIQNLYIMEVKKDENGNLKAALKDTAIKDWQDPYHQECPMKW